ncbi:hypothetical protein MBLNU230_g1909t1 [Neophaeotheca triangularis]
MLFTKTLSLVFLAIVSIQGLPGKDPKSTVLVTRDGEAATLAATSSGNLLARQSPDEVAKALATILTAAAPKDLIGTISATLNAQLATLLVNNDNIPRTADLIARTLGQSRVFAESVAIIITALRAEEGGSGC